MKRARRVVVVAHCLLNVNTKVHGIAGYESVHPEVVRLISEGLAIVQLPCPEATFSGMRRWGMTKEQYDTAAYRRNARGILMPIVDTLEELVRDGCEITDVIGVDGSPSCGVTRTCCGWTGGELGSETDIPAAVVVPGSGVFIEQLRTMLGERDMHIEFRGVDE